MGSRHYTTEAFRLVVEDCLSDDLFMKLCEVVSRTPQYREWLPDRVSLMDQLGNWMPGDKKLPLLVAVDALAEKIQRETAWSEARHARFDQAFEVALRTAEATLDQTAHDIAWGIAINAAWDEEAEFKAQRKRRWFINTFLTMMVQWPLEWESRWAQKALMHLYVEVTGEILPGGFGGYYWPSSWKHHHGVVLGRKLTLYELRERLRQLSKIN